MFTQERRLFSFITGYAHLLSQDVTEAQFSAQPLPGMNPPVWIIGHLAVVADLGLKLMGQPTLCPAHWPRDFGPGSKVLQYTGAAPSKAEVLERMSVGHERFSDAAQTLSEPFLSRAQPIAALQPGLATMADLIAHMLTSHPSMHLGQFSAWRRAMGLGPVLAI